MGYKFAAVEFGPILLVQGIYVRLVTPKLSEPTVSRAKKNDGKMI